GVPTLTYLPFVFFSLFSPVFSLISAFTGLGVKKISSLKTKDVVSPTQSL
ncbi:MAG: Na+/H+ antiporter NhaC, partial [Lactococcus sp.]